jgi:hypothetical protein
MYIPHVYSIYPGPSSRDTLLTKKIEGPIPVIGSATPETLARSGSLETKQSVVESLNAVEDVSHHNFASQHHQYLSIPTRFDRFDFFPIKILRREFVLLRHKQKSLTYMCRMIT